MAEMPGEPNIGGGAFGNFLLNKRWTFKEKVWS